VTRKCKICCRSLGVSTCPECRAVVAMVSAAHDYFRDDETLHSDRPAGWGDRLEWLSRRADAGLPLFGE